MIRKAKIFIEIYLTLDSFQVHIIKGILPNLVQLLERSDQVQPELLQEWGILGHLDIVWMVLILLNKGAHHQNECATKSFIKFFMQQKIQINSYEEFIYDNIIPILNQGSFYKDANQVEDSKFTKTIIKFFLVHLSSIGEVDLVRHLKKLFTSLTKHIFIYHAAESFFLFFAEFKRPSPFFSSDMVEQLAAFMQKIYIQFPTRKKNNVLRGLFSIFFNNMDHASFSLPEIVHLYTMVPVECYRWATPWHNRCLCNAEKIILNDQEVTREAVLRTQMYRLKMQCLLIKNMLYQKHNLCGYITETVARASDDQAAFDQLVFFQRFIDTEFSAAASNLGCLAGSEQV